MSIEQQLERIAVATEATLDVLQGLAAKVEHIGCAVETVQAPEGPKPQASAPVAAPPPAAPVTSTAAPTADVPAAPVTPAAPAAPVALTLEQMNERLIAEVKRLTDAGVEGYPKIVEIMKQSFGVDGLQQLPAEKYQELLDQVAQL